MACAVIVGLLASASIAWPGSHSLSVPVAVNPAVNTDNSISNTYQQYSVSAGRSHGPPATVNVQFCGKQTYYVLAGDTPVLVHNNDPCGTTFHHGTDIESAADLLNGVPLDAGAAAARHTDGPGGFFMATHYDDAEYFALRRTPGFVVDITFSARAMDPLRGAGAAVRDIPGGPRSVRFAGQEFHVPTSAFDLFNELRRSGDIIFAPHRSTAR